MARKPTKKKKKARPGRKVVDLAEKRAEKITNELQSIRATREGLLDEQARLIVDAYHAWERAHPDAALWPLDKMMMVRLGFVGPGGFDRCHEDHRLPETAFFTGELDVAEEIRRDRSASEVLMCPAMESRRCQPVWRGARMPPCYLLLLEIHQGLGGRATDDAVEDVVSDYGRWGGPEEYAASFVRADRLLRPFEEKHGARRPPIGPAASDET